MANIIIKIGKLPTTVELPSKHEMERYGENNDTVIFHCTWHDTLPPEFEELFSNDIDGYGITNNYIFGPIIQSYVDRNLMSF